MVVINWTLFGGNHCLRATKVNARIFAQMISSYCRGRQHGTHTDINYKGVEGNQLLLVTVNCRLHPVRCCHPVVYCKYCFADLSVKVYGWPLTPTAFHSILRAS